MSAPEPRPLPLPPGPPVGRHPRPPFHAHPVRLLLKLPRVLHSLFSNRGLKRHEFDVPGIMTKRLQRLQWESRQGRGTSAGQAGGPPPAPTGLTGPLAPRGHQVPFGRDVSQY